MIKKRAQISTEYLILVGFIVFLVIIITSIATFYIVVSKDKILFSNLESYASNIIMTSESVFYSGRPSKATITPYLPARVNSIQIEDNYIIFNVSTSSGESIISYRSNVKMSGSLTTGEGARKIRIEARDDDVLISEIQ